jgi:hypothetical protein
VVERGEDLRLAAEAGDALGVLREGGGQHLDRHLAAELRVARAQHLAHAAGADRGGDAVVGERLSDQWQTSRLSRRLGGACGSPGGWSAWILTRAGDETCGAIRL